MTEQLGVSPSEFSVARRVPSPSPEWVQPLMRLAWTSKPASGRRAVLVGPIPCAVQLGKELQPWGLPTVGLLAESSSGFPRRLLIPFARHPCPLAPLQGTTAGPSRRRPVPLRSCRPSGSCAGQFPWGRLVRSACYAFGCLCPLAKGFGFPRCPSLGMLGGAVRRRPFLGSSTEQLK
jgi:hypothetical protein